MPEMEKGRPPENKRSRKPAHPVKREINQEMKTFAESTMNELLGWYGYDKVELRDSEATEIRGYPNRDRRQQHVSVLKENAVSKPKSLDSKASPSALAMRSGERESSSVPSSSSSSSSPSSSLTSPKEHKSAPVIVPLIKPSAVEDVQNVQIVCVWCQKEGVKRYSLCMGSELKSFCSEKCFAACRRAYFKRNKARDEDLHGERSPQRPHPDDSPRLVLKMNSGARVCDWCKHIRHTKEYLDFGSGEERLQFCSTKCLNQYKMDVFYREARAALTSSSPGGAGGAEGKAEGGAGAGGQKLLTPESWSSGGGGAGDARQRTLSPKGPTPIHGTAAPTSVSPSEASSSSSKVPVAGLRPPERLLPPPPPPPPPLSEAGPRPSPLPPRPHHMEHHHPPLPQIPIPFIRPPLHAQGLKSPLAAAHPPRHPGPPSSPIHWPPHSPHLQPPSASSMNPPGLMHPYPGAYFPGLHSPPINMMPRGPAPFPPPPMMNFGIPSFAPLLPQPTVLVPYPIIVPFPVPIPIPVPFPVPRRGPPDPPAHGGVIQPVPEGGAERGRSRGARQPSPGAPVAGVGRTPVQGPLSPPGPHGRDADWVKWERQRPSPASTPRGGESSPGPRYNGPPCSAPEGPTDSKPVLQNQNQQQQPERQVIQRLQRTQVKQEPGPQGPVDSSGPGEPDGGEQGGGAWAGHYDGVRPPRSPSHDSVYRRDANSPSPRATPSPAGGSPPSDDGTVDAPTSLDEQNRATSSLDRPPSPDSSSSSPSPSPSQPPIPAPPPDPAPSELEAVKENQGRAGIGDAPPRPEEPPAAGGDGDDAHIPDEDHAYALPTAPRPAATPAATPAALLLPKLRDKGALRSPPPPGVVGGGDTEPALKRRCLRIRDQNK